MTDILLFFTIVSVTINVYVIYLIRGIVDELGRIQAWADNVDEFIEGEFIELDIDLEDE